MSEVTNQLGDLVDKMDNVKIAKVADDSNLNLASPEKVFKHPLQNAWTLWFFKNDKSRTWEDNQRPIITVTTVEDFWALYNHIETPSKLPAGSDYSLFKEGIFPDWEDPRNQAGGRWIINLERKKREELLDNHWLEVMFFLIGEHADEQAHLVNGAVVNIRNKTDKIAIWLAEAGGARAGDAIWLAEAGGARAGDAIWLAEAGGARAEEDPGVVRVGRMIKDRLGLKEKSGFNVHKDEKNSKYSKAKYYV